MITGALLSSDGAANTGLTSKSNYKKGELVLAKWTDCKLYSATVLKKVKKGL